MAKRKDSSDGQDEKVLGTGAHGDVEDPAAGAPVEPVAVEVTTDTKVQGGSK